SKPSALVSTTRGPAESRPPIDLGRSHPLGGISNRIGRASAPFRRSRPDLVADESHARRESSIELLEVFSGKLLQHGLACFSCVSLLPDAHAHSAEILRSERGNHRAQPLVPCVPSTALHADVAECE